MKLSDNHITIHRVLLNKEMISRSSLNTFEHSWLRVLFWAGFESAFLSTAGRELFFKHLFYYSQTRVLFWVFLSTFLSALSIEYIFEHSKRYSRVHLLHEFLYLFDKFGHYSDIQLTLNYVVNNFPTFQDQWASIMISVKFLVTIHIQWLFNTNNL